MGVLVTQLFNGLSVGSILLLAALGLSLTFGQMGVINMAHGEFIMAGAYTAYVTHQVLGTAGLSLLVSLPIAFVVAGLLGVLLEVTLHPADVPPPARHAAGDVGCRLVLQQLARDIFGAAGVDVPAPALAVRSASRSSGSPVPPSRLFILVLSIAAFAALAAGLKYTSLGRRIRATVQNRQLAESAGISTRATDRITFFIGSGLAGVAGVALTLIGLDLADPGHRLHHRRLPRGRRRRHRPDQGHGDRRLRRSASCTAFVEYTTTAASRR